MLDTCSSLLDADQYDKVVKCCDEYLKMKPKSGPAWHLKGLAYQKKGDTAKAYESFEKAAEIDRTEPANYYAIGMLLYNEGKFENALHTFQICNVLVPRIEHYFMIAVSCIMLNRQEDAEVALRTAITLDKKKTVSVMEQFFNKNYKNDKTTSEEEKVALKAVIDKLAKSK